MKKFIIASVCATIPMTSGAFTVSLPAKGGLSTASGKSTGHEEITRQAILLGVEAARLSLPSSLTEMENKILTQDIKNKAWGTLGYATHNPVIRGNHSNDIEQTPNYIFVPKYLGYVPFLKQSTATVDKKTGAKIYRADATLRTRSFWMWYNLDSPFANLTNLTPAQKAKRIAEVKKNMGGNWDYNYEFQTAHSLRDIKMSNDGKKLISIKSERATCERTRSYINNLAILAAKQLEKAQLQLKDSEKMSGTKKEEWIKFSKDSTRQAFFHLGQATHSLQDSFSAAHTKRANIGSDTNYNIQQICVYGDGFAKMLGNNGKKACYHFEYVPGAEELGKSHLDALKGYRNKANEGLTAYTNGEMHDSIWVRGGYFTADKSTFKQFPNYVQTEESWAKDEQVNLVPLSNLYVESVGGKWANMKHEARMARTATAKYLYVFLEYISDIRNNYYQDDANKTLLSQRLKERFFEGFPTRLISPKVITDEGDDSHGKMGVVEPGYEQKTLAVAPIKEVMSNGVFRCDHLSDTPLVPAN